MVTALLEVGVLATAARADDAIAVIANAEFVELEELSLPLLRQLYLGRRTQVGGRSVHFFQPPPGSARAAFARVVLQLSERDLDHYWLEQALSGGPIPPREIASREELVRRVAVRRGALAYLEWEALQRLPRTGVKVIPLRIDGRRLLPGDPGYPLRERDEAGQGEAPGTPAAGAGGRHEGR